MLRALVRAALVLSVTSALPLRAPARILSCLKPWKGCPEEGGSRLGLAGFSEAMALYDDDKSGSASAWTGENGLDSAASKVFATSVAATMERLQLYQNHASAEVALAAPDATKSGVDEEEAAHGRASWWPFQFLALLLELLLGLFVFGRIIPRRSSLAKGAAWRSYVAAYLLISPEIALCRTPRGSPRRPTTKVKLSSRRRRSPSPRSHSLTRNFRRETSALLVATCSRRVRTSAWGAAMLFLHEWRRRQDRDAPAQLWPRSPLPPPS